MARHGKRYIELRKKVDPQQVYDPIEAINLAKDMASAKFDETIELHMRMGVDPRHADQVVRGSVVLPAGTGKKLRVLAFAQGDRAREAQEAGADIVGAEELVQQIQGGWMEFDVAVATPDVMPIVQRLGRILGPRGLLPNPRTGTVSDDLAKLIRDVRAGRVEFRVDRTAVIHAPVGKASFTPDQLQDNLSAIVTAVMQAKPPAAKGQYIHTITLAPTMGPGVRLDVQPTVGLTGAKK
jgi:large subunit ribosomal protein L1